MTSNQIEFAKHKETQRHNLVTETQSDKNIRESIRHNRATESVSSGSLEESIRHNKRTESLSQEQIMNNYTVGLMQASASQAQAAASLQQASVASQRQQEDARHNLAMEQETNRHNMYTENLGSWETGIKAANVLVDVGKTVASVKPK